MFPLELPFLGKGSVHSCSCSGLSSLILPSLQGLHPPRAGAAQQEVGGGWQSFTCPPHGSQDGLNHPPCPPSHQREKLSSAKLFPGTKKAGGRSSTPHPSLSALLPNIFRIQPGLLVVSLLDSCNSLSPAFWVHLCPATSLASPDPYTLHVQPAACY